MNLEENNRHLQNLSEIRSIMERSTGFLSLSGLSGVFAGIFALIGASFAYWYVSVKNSVNLFKEHVTYNELTDKAVAVLTLDAVIVLIVSLISVLYFTKKNAARKGQKAWDNTSKRMLINLAIPLVAGGLFSIILMFQKTAYILPAVTLIFYGLALINASKYTLSEIRYLGIFEIVLGLGAAVFLGYGLFFWAFGFGILHIIYGILMYVRHEKDN